MMQLEPKNALIYDQIISMFNQREKVPVNTFICEDYEKCSYHIYLDLDKSNKITFSFNCYDFQNIFAVYGPEMLQKYYSDLICEPKPFNNFNISLSIDFGKFPPISSSEEKEKIKAIHAELISSFADKLSRFKRNFYAAPFERAFEGVKAGKASPKSEYSCRPSERVWIIPANDNVTVFFGISFEDPVDKAIAKLILAEMEEAKRQIKNSPSVTKMHEDRIPEALIQEFPSLKGQTMKYNNGLIGMTLFKNHIGQNYDKPADFLQGFRQYLHYHIYASKTYLHGRLRKKVASLKSQLDQARFEEDGVKLYRTEKGESVQERDDDAPVSLTAASIIKKK